MDGSCWLWDGSYYSHGYGQAWSRRLQRSTQAHRLVYESLVGPIPKGMQLDHLCRVRGCVNPAHLRVVTARENVLAPGARCLAKRNALKERCSQGHPYSEENTYTTPRGRRQCRICKRAEKRRRRSRRATTRGGGPGHGVALLGSCSAVTADTTACKVGRQPVET